MHWNKHIHNGIPFVCSLAQRCMYPSLTHALDAFQALYRKTEAETLDQTSNLSYSVSKPRGRCILGMVKAFYFMEPEGKNNI